MQTTELLGRAFSHYFVVMVASWFQHTESGTVSKRMAIATPEDIEHLARVECEEIYE